MKIILAPMNVGVSYFNVLMFLCFNIYMYYKSYSRHIKPKKRRKRWFKKRQTLPPPQKENGLRNPYRVTTGDRGLRNKITCTATVIMSLIWAGIIVLHPYFQIRDIIVSGTVNIDAGTVEEALSIAISSKILWIFPQNNFFLINKEHLQKITSTRFPVESTVITKAFPHKLYIEITERLAFVIYDNGQQYTLIDEFSVPQKTLRDIAIHEQKIIEHQNWGEKTVTSTIHYPDVKALQVQYGAYPIVYDKKQDGQLPTEVVQGIIQIYSFLKDNIDFTTHHFIHPNEYETLLVEDANGLTIVFNPYENLDKQLETLKHAWQRELRKEKGSRARINARYPGRVYVEEDS